MILRFNQYKVNYLKGRNIENEKVKSLHMSKFVWIGRKGKFDVFIALLTFSSLPLTHHPSNTFYSKGANQQGKSQRTTNIKLTGGNTMGKLNMRMPGSVDLVLVSN